MTQIHNGTRFVTVAEFTKNPQLFLSFPDHQGTKTNLKSFTNCREGLVRVASAPTDNTQRGCVGHCEMEIASPQGSTQIIQVPVYHIRDTKEGNGSGVSLFFGIVTNVANPFFVYIGVGPHNEGNKYELDFVHPAFVRFEPNRSGLVVEPSRAGTNNRPAGSNSAILIPPQVQVRVQVQGHAAHGAARVNRGRRGG